MSSDKHTTCALFPLPSTDNIAFDFLIGYVSIYVLSLPWAHFQWLALNYNPPKAPEAPPSCMFMALSYSGAILLGYVLVMAMLMYWDPCGKMTIGEVVVLARDVINNILPGATLGTAIPVLFGMFFPRKPDPEEDPELKLPRYTDEKTVLSEKEFIEFKEDQKMLTQPELPLIELEKTLPGEETTSSENTVPGEKMDTDYETVSGVELEEFVLGEATFPFEKDVGDWTVLDKLKEGSS